MKSLLHNPFPSFRWLSRKPSLAVAIVLLLVLGIAAHPIQTKPFTFATSEPEAPLGVYKQVASETEEEYQKKLAERVAKDTTFVPLKRKPGGLSPAARFGSNFSLEGHNLSWVLDGDEQKGYVIYVDLNANGDLSDDQPLRFEKQNGWYSCLFRATVHDLKKDPQQTYPLTLKLEISQITPPGQTQPQLFMSIHAITTRRGVIHVGQKDVAFSLKGRLGIYDGESSDIYFDLDGDGQLDQGLNSMERYFPSDKYVNIGETSYEFAVDRYGRSLTLKPLAEKLPPRPTLLPGYAAPDFTFTGLDGKAHKLSDYRGKVVLLDFWGTWCGPCVAAVPKLTEAYDKYRARGFEIVGVDANDTEEKLREFITAKKLTWIQDREEETGPVHRLYRVVAWPSYFLIGKDGTIVATGIGSRNLLAEMEQLMAAAEK